jgi:hypothetical protein
MLIERRYFLITELLPNHFCIVILIASRLGSHRCQRTQLDITYSTTAMQLSTLTGLTGRHERIRQTDRFLLPSLRPILGADVF